MAVKRDELLVRIRETLAKTGFYVSDPHNIRSISFDVIARRDKQLLIIKALANIDSLSSDDAEELRILATTLDGKPMVIGLHSSSGDLEEGILYSRFGIPIISEATFHEHMLEGVPPFVYAAPGGLYVDREEYLAGHASGDRRRLEKGNPDVREWHGRDD
jgi:putative transcriptional regulator